MRDPDKRRFLNAVNHVESEEIAFYECDPDISQVNKILGKNFPLSLHAYELPIPDYVELNRRMGNDMIYFSHIWRLGRKQMEDEEGRLHYVDGTMKTQDSLKDIWRPNLDHLEARLEELLNLIDGSGFGVVCGIQSASFTVSTAIGIQDYWYNTVDNPGFIHEFQKRLHEYCMREQERFMQYPIDAIKIGSGFVTKTGPMCSPGMLEEFQTAYLREESLAAVAKGLPVYCHIDGNITGIIPGILDMGVRIINPIEPCSGRQDIYEIKRLWGQRLALCGNIDIDGVLLNGTPAEVKQDVQEHIDRLAVGGGYVVASSHDIHQLIPLANFYAMRDAVHEYRFRPGKAIPGESSQGLAM
jgi:uroporphyrinogen decarboxylase